MKSNEKLLWFGRCSEASANLAVVAACVQHVETSDLPAAGLRVRRAPSWFGLRCSFFLVRFTLPVQAPLPHSTSAAYH